MNSWKVILATVVIFGAGVLAGGLLVNHVDHERRAPHHRSPEAWRKAFIGHLDKVLKLTPQQHAAISKIVAEGQARNLALWRQEMEQVHHRIHAELTPEQQKKFEKMLKEFAARHSSHVHPPKQSPSTNHVSPHTEGGATGP